MSDWDDFENRRWWTPQKPRAVEGGIRAHSTRGGFGDHWWTQQWIRVLESVRVGSRLERGARYARMGHVVTLRMEAGAASAEVQGSRPKPYRVRIELPAYPAAKWQNLAAELAGHAAWTARLLNGDLPRELEEFCQSRGMALLPASAKEVRSDCSCPDEALICKHIGAIWMLLAEEIDRDPLLLFRLRGIERDELMKLLHRGNETPSRPEAPPSAQEPARSLSVARFWQGTAIDQAIFGDLPESGVFSPPLQRLGPFPFWQGGEPLEKQLRPVYEQAARHGLRWWMGEETEGEASS